MAKTKKMKVDAKVEDCPWEAGELGNSVEHAIASSGEHERSVDDAMGMQMISIRLPKSLIEDLKYFAEREGLGYQPLMRRVLVRWASHEFKLMAQERFASSLATATTPTNAEDEVYPEDHRMAACG